MSLQVIPTEVVEDTLLYLEPLDVSRVAQTSRFYRALVYQAPDDHLWRDLYLQEPLDDPRECVDHLGRWRNPKSINWMQELQRITRASVVLPKLEICRPGEKAEVLKTFLHLVEHTKPCRISPTDVDSADLSLNLLWVAAHLKDGPTLDPAHFKPTTTLEKQLLAKLHSHFGIIESDTTPECRLRARARVYDLGNYSYDNSFGPFMRSDKVFVDWEHLKAVHHTLELQLLDVGNPNAQSFMATPMSMPYCQSIIPLNTDIDSCSDWAGIEGLWSVSFSFCDHRALLAFNNDGDPDLSIFEDPEFAEVFTSMEVKLKVMGTEFSPRHPTRPKIFFAGEMHGHSTINGHVGLTDDDRIRWQFVSGEAGQAIWSSEGVQVGSVRSMFGVLGVWTTVFHDNTDPVGPFWLRKCMPKSSST